MNGTETLTTVQRHDENAIAPSSSGGAMEIAQTRAAQEVQAAMVVAKKFPRDEEMALARIEKACCRTKLAEISQYHFPKGSGEVSGPTVHLAKVLAGAWGNIDSGIIELEQRQGESVMMAYCWDLESNRRETKVFTVPHIREKKGKNGLEQIALEGARDVYEATANMGSRRERACILSVIPRDVQDTAVEICNQTLAADFNEDKRDRMIAAFENDFGVTQEQLETFVGRRAPKFDGGTYVRLRRVYSTLKDGFAKVQDFFPPVAQPNGKERSKFGFSKKDKQEKATKQSQSVDTPQEATDEAQSDATEGAPEATDSGVDAPDWDGPTEDTEFLYWCDECQQGFVAAATRKVNGQMQTCCPTCKAVEPILMAWDDHLATITR